MTLFCYTFHKERYSQYVDFIQQETVLGTADVAGLAASDVFPVNRQTFPGLQPVQEELFGPLLNGVAAIVVCETATSVPLPAFR